MASTVANGGSASKTLTLMPFHTDSQRKQTQHYRLPKIVQQPPPTVASSPARNSQAPRYTPAFSKSLIVNNARGVPNAPLSVAKPTVVNTRNTPRAPNPTVSTKPSNALTLQPKSPAGNRTTRQHVGAVAKVHAISPISATSIDSILRADSSQDVKKSAVPDRLRPKAEAINTACPMIAIKLQQAESTVANTLYAHEDVLNRSSEVLQSLLKSIATSSEQQQRTISLAEADAKSLNIYLNWLYIGNVHAGHRKDEAPTKASPEGYTGLSRLVKCYQLGWRLQDVHFQDAMLDAIVTLVTVGKQQGKTMLGLIMHRVKHHYIQLPTGSKGRRLFVHLFAHFGDWRLLDKNDSQAFLLETSEVIKRGAANDPTVAAAKCIFHEHQGGKCYRDMWL